MCFFWEKNFLEVTMICTNCKKEIGENVKFCPECGAKIEIVDEKVDKAKILEKEEVAVERGQEKEGTLAKNEIVPDGDAEKKTEEKKDAQMGSSPKSRLGAAFLALLFGWTGAHRFYCCGGSERKIGYIQIIISSIPITLFLLSVKSFGNDDEIPLIVLCLYAMMGVVWFFWDFAFILAGKFKDSQGRLIKKWRPLSSCAIAMYVSFIGIVALFCSMPLFINMHKDYVYKHSQKYLHDSIEKGNVKAVIELIDYGLDINQSGKGIWAATEYTPLWRAVNKGELAIVKLLLEAGANANEIDYDLCKDSKEWCVKNPTVLYKAVDLGYASIVKVLIDNGAKTNIKIDIYECEEGDKPEGVKEGELRPFGDWVYAGFFTPLMAAARNDDIDVIKILLDNDSDLLMEDYYGNTAIDYARMFKSNNALKVLLNYRKKIYGY